MYWAIFWYMGDWLGVYLFKGRSILLPSVNSRFRFALRNAIDREVALIPENTFLLSQLLFIVEEDF